jgi:hypothetical protein
MKISVGKLYLIACIYLTWSFVGSCAFAQSSDKDAEFLRKYPYGLQTPSYGVLSEDDLQIDALRVAPGPPGQNGVFFGHNRWQCFPRSNIKFIYRTWRGNDGMGPSDVIVTMCAYDFIGTLNGETQVYGARRAHPVDRCRFIARAWKKLTRGEPYVCLNGEGGGLDESSSKPGSKERVWIWDKFKTRKGCHSLFGRYCDLAYWREQYPDKSSAAPAPTPPPALPSVPSGP